MAEWAVLDAPPKTAVKDSEVGYPLLKLKQS